MVAIEPQSLSNSSSKTAISWTGGKDCNLALLKAWRDPTLEVTCLVCFTPTKPQSSSEEYSANNEKKSTNRTDASDDNKSNNPFRAHPIPLMQAQAKSLNLPLHFIIISPPSTLEEKEDGDYYKKEYVNGLTQFKKDYGVSVICTGDMDLVGTMTRNWMEQCCDEVVLLSDDDNNISSSSHGENAAKKEMRVYLPLWQANRLAILQELLAENFIIIFSCVKSPFFDASWIGKKLDQGAVQDLERISLTFEHGNSPTNCTSSLTDKNDHESNTSSTSSSTSTSSSCRLKPLDVGGERGEYHTMCIDGPLYRYPIRIKMGKEPFCQEYNQITKWKGNTHNANYVWSMAYLGVDVPE